MRNVFIKVLTELAQKDERIYLLTGDLGFSVFELFAQKFPKRFLNCGVAEQNMMGVAAGLALAGKKPYVYSIVPFVTMRCFEQIRNDICYQNLDVKIIGMGGGLSYGPLGATHHAIEDIAILRVLPNMTLLCPADVLETEELVLKSYQTSSPTYLRLSKNGKEPLYSSRPQLEIGKPSLIRDGKDGAFIASGIPVGLCLKVIERLKELGQDFKLISLPTLKPVDKKALLKEFSVVKKIFTIEEHSRIGGLGSLIAEILAEAGWQGKFKIIALPDEYSLEVGSAEYLRKKYGFERDKIIKEILNKTSS